MPLRGFGGNGWLVLPPLLLLLIVIVSIACSLLELVFIVLFFKTFVASKLVLLGFDLFIVFISLISKLCDELLVLLLLLLLLLKALLVDVFVMLNSCWLDSFRLVLVLLLLPYMYDEEEIFKLLLLLLLLLGLIDELLLLLLLLSFFSSFFRSLSSLVSFLKNDIIFIPIFLWEVYVRYL